MPSLHSTTARMSGDEATRIENGCTRIGTEMATAMRVTSSHSIPVSGMTRIPTDTVTMHGVGTRTLAQPRMGRVTSMSSDAWMRTGMDGPIQ